MRKSKEIMDVDGIANIIYNDQAGGKKVIIVEPVVKSAVLSTDSVPFGSYVKVTGTSYTLDMILKAYNTGSSYSKGEIVTSGGFVWFCIEATTGTFDATKWENKAAKSIGPVSISAGALVSVGQWHNCVTAAGFLIEDSSKF
jgi:hypothetical protein